MKDDIYEYYLIEEGRKPTRNSNSSRSFSVSMQEQVVMKAPWIHKSPSPSGDLVVAVYSVTNANVMMEIVWAFTVLATLSRMKCVLIIAVVQFALK